MHFSRSKVKLVLCMEEQQLYLASAEKGKREGGKEGEKKGMAERFCGWLVG